ncbi:type II toxin-antitoxin system RelB/DinJ family antitoxin [Halomonas sp. AOP5-B2-8]
MDHDTKVAFTSICDDLGLSPSQALKLFARAVINHGGIPFELKTRQPNETTAAAIQELAEGKGHHAFIVSPAWNHGLHALCLNLFTDTLAVIAFVSHQRIT